MEKITKQQCENLIERITEYQAQLADNKRVSLTAFQHMQTAIYGVKCIIRDEAGMQQVREAAMSK